MKTTAKRAACALGACAALWLAACTEDAPATSVWPELAPVRGTAPLGYVTNVGSDTLSVIELDPLREIARAPVGLVPVHPEGPHHLAIDAVRGFVYVGISNVVPFGGSGPHGSHGGGTVDSVVQRLRLSDLGRVDTVRVDTNLGDIVLSPDGTRAVTTHFDRALAMRGVTTGRPEDGWASLVLIDALAMRKLGEVAVCAAPHGVLLSEDGARAYVACYGDDRVAIVDLSVLPPRVLSRLEVGPGARPPPTPLYGPYSVTRSPDGTLAYVGNLEGGGLRVLDLRTETMDDARAVALEGAAYFGAFSEDGARYYVPTQGMDALASIEVATGRASLVRTFEADECIAPHEVVLPRGLARGYLVCEGDHRTPGKVIAFDRTTLSTTAEIEVGVYPDALRVVYEVTW